jgi:hypothetical protein
MVRGVVAGARRPHALRIRERRAGERLIEAGGVALRAAHHQCLAQRGVTWTQESGVAKRVRRMWSGLGACAYHYQDEGGKMAGVAQPDARQADP